MNHLQLGQDGEALAVKHLRNKGLTILDRNYRFGRGELDIICKDHQFLVVVEVKTRSSNINGEPYISVSRKKQRQIIQVTNRFIQSRDIDLEVRFDIISVILNSSLSRLEHIENAFTP